MSLGRGGDGVRLVPSLCLCESWSVGRGRLAITLADACVGVVSGHGVVKHGNWLFRFWPNVRGMTT